MDKNNNEISMLTTLSEDKAIDLININTQIADKLGFTSYIDINKDTLFYGIVDGNNFTLHTTAHAGSHLYMAINGSIENFDNGTKNYQ